MRLPLVPYDKAQHVIYGAGLALVLIALGTVAGLPAGLVFAASGLVCIGAAVAKERWDARGHGTPEVADVWASVAGWAGIAAAYLLGRV
jgi:hypothetical protein